MASRPAFLSGARLSSAKPKERPREKPRKPERKPPDRKLPPDRKPPRRKPLRRPEPRKPEPKKPLRRTPLFPRKPLPKTKPFGKWVPNTGTPLPPMRRWQVAKLMRFARFLGPIGIALTLWELYELYRWYQGQEGGLYPPPGDGYRYCSARDPGTWPFGPFGRFAGPTLSCTEGLNWSSTVPSWEPGRPWYWTVQRRLVSGGRYRTKPMEGWYYPTDPGMLPEMRPETPPLLLPPELPYPYPYSDPPLPWTPPLERPQPEPRPDFDDRPPWRRNDGDPDPLTRNLPDVEWEIGKEPRPDFHERRPPRRPEKEKKKRIEGMTALQWWKFLNKGVASFTEIDDAVSAIYKGLPWQYRRWKGRDGVWRDRDITTTTRSQRLWQLVGKIDIQTAVTELIKNEFSDRAFGTVGNRLKRRTKELSDEGLWSGFQGLGQNPNRFNDSWEEVYKKLKREATEREKRLGLRHNWYYTRHWDADKKTFVGKWRQRPVTQIPWFRQRSAYDRRVDLTGQWYGAKDYRPRYYYDREFTRNDYFWLDDDD